MNFWKIPQVFVYICVYTYTYAIYEYTRIYPKCILLKNGNKPMFGNLANG